MITTQITLKSPKVIAGKTATRRTFNQELRALVADVLLPGEAPERFILAAVRHLRRHRLESKAVQVALAVLHEAGVADVSR